MDGDPGRTISIHEHESPLGRWRVAVRPPHPRLAALVAAMWFGEGRVNYRRDRILPGGTSHLLINLGAPQYLVVHERRIAFTDAWFSGLHQGPIDTEAPDGNALFGVAFHAAGARPWLDLDLHETADRIVELAALCGDGVLALREQLLNAASIAQRFALVEAWLLSRLERRREVHPAVHEALARIARTRGHVEIAAIARESGYSRKHLVELFRRDVGLAPKQYARVERFKQALALIGGTDAPMPWSELAVATGHSDQSHFIREFRAHTGLTPRQYAASPRPDAGSVVIR